MQLRHVIGGLMAAMMMLSSAAFADVIEADATAEDTTTSVDEDAGPGEDDVMDPEPPAPTDPYVPNDCWAEQCAAEYEACNADAACVAFSQCSEPGVDGQACYAQYEVDHPGTTDDQGNHPLYKALQACGWSACNDPTAASCADPGKDGAVNRCEQWDNSWPCNCDQACETYGDCCEDACTTCGIDCPDLGTSCAGACDTVAPDNGLACSCDVNCTGAGCCNDACSVCGYDCPPPACTDACTLGDTGCSSVTEQWTCLTGADGCAAQVVTDCAALDKTCDESTGTCGSAPVVGCTSSSALNFDPTATVDSGECEYPPMASDDGGCATGPWSASGLLALLLLAGAWVTVRRRTGLI